MTHEAVRNLVRIERQIAQVEESLKELKSQAESLKPVVLEFMFAEGVASQRIDVDGMQATVFTKQRTFAGLVDGVSREDAVEAVAALAPQLVKRDFNLNSLSTYIRELVEEQRSNDPMLPAEQAVPEGLRPYITPRQKTEVQVRLS